ncbi:MAG TPA: hypothetical protein VG986_17035, partial [Pseudolabrys sp.]|nr:hypothetical protein [Pseudolabrys sp.]
KFGTVAATNVSVTNATSLSAKTPQHAAGSVMVSVATPGGTGHRAAAYTYTAAAGLTVKNVMVPSTDLGKFNQIVDGTTRAANAGSGGTTGVLALAPGAHVVSETAGSGTNATNYTSVIGGNCNPLGDISLATNAFKTKAPMPEALAGSAVAVLNNLLFVIAGDGSKAVHVYSPLSNQGTTLTSAPLPYNRHLLGAGVICRPHAPNSVSWRSTESSTPWVASTTMVRTTRRATLSKPTIRSGRTSRLGYSTRGHLLCSEGGRQSAQFLHTRGKG